MRALLALAATSVFAIGAVYQAQLPAALGTHFDKLEGAKTLNVEYTFQKIGGARMPIKLSFSKQNQFVFDSPETRVVCDGTQLVTLTKKDATYTEEPVTETNIAAFASRLELTPWRALFQKDTRKELVAAAAGSRRNLSGNEVTEVAVTFKNGMTGTYFVDNKLGFARGANLKAKGEDSLILASKIEIDKETPATTFKFVAPAGAKKKEPAPAAPAYEDVQAIFTQSCMPCHNSQNRKAGLDLTNYEGAKMGVVPGDAAGSIIVKSLRGQGARQMPLRAAPLPEEKIKQIEAWINAGASNK